MNRRKTLSETETLKKNQAKILELGNSTSEVENAIESTARRADHAEESR